MREGPGVKGAFVHFFIIEAQVFTSGPFRPGFLLPERVESLSQSVVTRAISQASPRGGMGLAISALLETFREAPDYKRLVEATAGSQPLITGLSGSQKSLYVAALADDPPGGRHFPAIVLTATQ